MPGTMIDRLSRRIEDNETVLTFLFDQLQDEEDGRRRLRYERELADAWAEGIDVEVEAELAELLPGAPADFESRRLGLIRKSYSRSSPGVRRRWTGAGSGKRIASPEDTAKVVDYAMAKGVSIPEAKQALGFA